MQFEIEEVIDTPRRCAHCGAIANPGKALSHDASKHAKAGKAADDVPAQVEIRARLEDGRLACLSVPKGTAAGYEVAVNQYLDEHIREKATPADS